MATLEHSTTLSELSIPAGVEEAFSVTSNVKPGSPASTTSSAGTKRKRAIDPKFYAVRVGYHPGIYHSWPECLAEVTGFKNATFKSFTSLTDAESFLAGGNPSHSQGLSSSQAYKFYGVQNGRVPGVYLDWASAQQQIVGWTKPKHKCFTSRAEAEKFVRDGRRKADAVGGVSTDPSASSAMIVSNAPASRNDKVPASKKQKKTGSLADGPTHSVKLQTTPYVEEDFEPGTGPLPLGAEDGFDPNIFLNGGSGEVEYKSEQQRKAVKLHANGAADSGMLRVYTDGSSLRNGAAGARGGVGVYFGPDDDRNVSEPLLGSRQTNQRAELTAMSRALEISPRHRDVTIFTDSKYSIDCVTLWYINWRRNGWQTSTKKPVENKDIIENILSKIEERNAFRVKTFFEWIKGHANQPGNVEADKLAQDGARGGIP
ncbi:MAG: hypothetical protein M1830_004358 [Pleopsidium flavum]|nr:MAG: hypothetical protein M1830_004358 [Pleopsidium flavum]